MFDVSTCHWYGQRERFKLVLPKLFSLCTTFTDGPPRAISLHDDLFLEINCERDCIGQTRSETKTLQILLESFCVYSFAHASFYFS